MPPLEPGPSGIRPDLRRRVAVVAHRYGLPVAGAVALVFGALATVRLWQEPAVVLPFLLLLVGAVALVTTFASLELLVFDRQPATAPGPGSVGRALADSAVGPPANPAVLSAPPGAPRSGLGRAAVQAATHVDDELWTRWAGPVAPGLGAAGDGPVPGAAYSTPRRGTPGPFPSRGHEAVSLTGPLARSGAMRARVEPTSPPSPARRAVDAAAGAARPAGSRLPLPFSEDELDRLFPPESSPGPAPMSSRWSGPDGSTGSSESAETEGEDAPSSAPLRTAPVPFAISGARSLTPPEPAGRSEASAEGPSVGSGSGDEPVAFLFSLEAVESGGYLGRVASPRPALGRIGPLREVPRRDEVAPPPARSCTECSARLTDFRAWADCPDCGTPLCRLCLSVSFLRGTMGSCSACRDPADVLVDPDEYAREGPSESGRDN